VRPSHSPPLKAAHQQGTAIHVLEGDIEVVIVVERAEETDDIRARGPVQRLELSDLSSRSIQTGLELDTLLRDDNQHNSDALDLGKQ
jgi:hypothetical protein